MSPSRDHCEVNSDNNKDTDGHVSIENSTKPPQDNANCGDIKVRIADHSDTTGGVPQDFSDFRGSVDQAIENKGFTESAIEAVIEAKEASPAFIAKWKLPLVYQGPRPTWVLRANINNRDISGYKIFLGGLWHVRNSTILEWLKSDCSDQYAMKAVLYVQDVNVVAPSQTQRSHDFKALTLRILMEGCT